MQTMNKLTIEEGFEVAVDKAINVIRNYFHLENTKLKKDREILMDTGFKGTNVTELLEVADSQLNECRKTFLMLVTTFEWYKNEFERINKRGDKEELHRLATSGLGYIKEVTDMLENVYKK